MKNKLIFLTLPLVLSSNIYCMSELQQYQALKTEAIVLVVPAELITMIPSDGRCTKEQRDAYRTKLHDFKISIDAYRERCLANSLAREDTSILNLLSNLDGKILSREKELSNIKVKRFFCCYR